MVQNGNCFNVRYNKCFAKMCASAEESYAEVIIFKYRFQAVNILHFIVFLQALHTTIYISMHIMVCNGMYIWYLCNNGYFFFFLSAISPESS